MTVKEIVTEYLEVNGYDGLYSDCGCICRISCLMPRRCEDCSKCKPGYLHIEREGDEHSWSINAVLPAPAQMPRRSILLIPPVLADVD